MKHKIVCAWCGFVIREGKEPASHGICDLCTSKSFRGESRG